MGRKSQASTKTQNIPCKGKGGEGQRGCSRLCSGGTGTRGPSSWGLPAQHQDPERGSCQGCALCGGSLEPPCTAREGLQLCLTHIPLVGCCSNSRGSSRPSQADEVAASHVAGKQGCTHLEKERNQIWPWHRASFSAWREHREAVPPLLTAEDTKSLSASAAFFSLQVKWLWHLSPASFTIHCQFVGMFGTILLPKHLISCG